MAAGGKLLLRFLLLQSLVMVALCCPCESLHLQEQFCDHEYVMKVLIKHEQRHPSKVAFVMETKKIYKGDRGKLKFRGTRDLLLLIPYYCNIDLMKSGDTYLIFGAHDGGSMYTSRCTGSENWNRITKTTKRALRNKYSAGCNCVGKAGTYDSCRWKYSYLKKVDDQCKWVKTSEFQKCLRKKKRGSNPRDSLRFWI